MAPIRTPHAPVIEQDIPGQRAWHRDGVTAADWTVPVPPACVDEMERALTQPRPLSIEAIRPDRQALGACAALMERVRQKLVDGPGIAVVDRFPVERYAADDAKAIGWILASLLGRVVAQKWDGTRLYDVKDSGRALGYGVRRSVTNLEQPFHTDGPWLWQPPAFVGLFCLATARAGGDSRVTSLVSAHNAMRARHRHLLDRLYVPFRWDRQAEHAPDDVRWATHPVFASDGGGLTARYYDDYITNGQRLAGEPLDAEGTDALAALREVVDAPEHRVEFRIEQGQLQYLNNRQVAHSRTAFRDSQEPGNIRHMLRLWNREEGTLHVDGQITA